MICSNVYKKIDELTMQSGPVEKMHCRIEQLRTGRNHTE